VAIAPQLTHLRTDHEDLFLVVPGSFTWCNRVLKQLSGCQASQLPELLVLEYDGDTPIFANRNPFPNLQKLSMVLVGVQSWLFLQPQPSHACFHFRRLAAVSRRRQLLLSATSSISPIFPSRSAHAHCFSANNFAHPSKVCIACLSVCAQIPLDMEEFAATDLAPLAKLQSLRSFNLVATSNP
jgi:hypothetical protein